MNFDAIILCGGSARRLDGADKKAVIVGGRTLLDRAIDAVGEASTIVAVGTPASTPRAVTWTQEQPPGGGPVAALAAGLALVTEPVIVVLGVDFPFVDRERVGKLFAAVGDKDGAAIADASGRHQFLVGAYRRTALARSLRDRDPHGMPVKELMAGLSLEMLEDPISARDCDTWVEVEQANELMEKEMS